MKLLIGAIAAVIVLGGLFFLYRNNPEIASQALKNASPQTTALPSPSTFPLQELTIPYLRNRSYQSKLGDLEKYSAKRRPRGTTGE